MKNILLKVAVVAVASMSSVAEAKVTEENFRLDTFGDLAALCGVAADDSNATAAIHMCHGYVTGLAHFHEMMGRALEGNLYCVSNETRPSRDEAIDMLVVWSRDNPQNNGVEAIDGVLMWAADAYPCP